MLIFIWSLYIRQRFICKFQYFGRQVIWQLMWSFSGRKTEKRTMPQQLSSIVQQRRLNSPNLGESELLSRPWIRVHIRRIIGPSESGKPKVFSSSRKVSCWIQLLISFWVIGSRRMVIWFVRLMVNKKRQSGKFLLHNFIQHSGFDLKWEENFYWSLSTERCDFSLSNYFRY